MPGTLKLNYSCKRAKELHRKKWKKKCNNDGRGNEEEEENVDDDDIQNMLHFITRHPPSCRMLMVHVIARSDDKKHNLDEDNLSEHLITSDSVPAHSLGDINQTRPSPLVHHLLVAVVVSKT